MRISDWSSDVCSSDLGGFIVASQQYGNGRVVVDGEGSLLDIDASFALSVGHRGTGLLEVTNGADVDVAAVDDATIRIGQNAGSHGTAIIGGAGSTLTTSGTDNSVVVAQNPSSTGSLVVEAGGRVNTLDLRAGRGGDGSITITGSGSEGGGDGKEWVDQ